jgi:hypothetical protein
MVRITITAAAFEAISATMPLRSVNFEPEGERHIWLERKFVDRLAAMRGPGESYSDVILTLARSRRGGRPRGWEGSMFKGLLVSLAVRGVTCQCPQYER